VAWRSLGEHDDRLAANHGGGAAMLTLPANIRLFLANNPVDFRVTPS
jgi:hypothetical protein